MFFHRDDAVAHRLRLSGNRPVAKKSPARTWSFVCEGAALMNAARTRYEKRWIGERLGGVLQGSPLPYRCHRTPLTHSPER
jgi:hypothetical protein